MNADSLLTTDRLRCRLFKGGMAGHTCLAMCRLPRLLIPVDEYYSC